MIYSYDLSSWSIIMIYYYDLFLWSILMIYHHDLLLWSIMIYYYDLLLWSIIMIYYDYPWNILSEIIRQSISRQDKAPELAAALKEAALSPVASSRGMSLADISQTVAALEQSLGEELGTGKP